MKTAAISSTLAAVLALVGFLVAHADDDPPVTTVAELVMYGVDADTDTLLRYPFNSDEYRVVGVVRDEDGHTLRDIESLGWIPHGPYKGMYGVPTQGNQKNTLIKISSFDATANVYPENCGFNDVEAMVAVQDPDTGAWSLYAVHDGLIPGGYVTICHYPPGEPDNPQTLTVGTAAVGSHLAHGDVVGVCGEGGYQVSDQNLISIDPASGAGTVVMPLSRPYEGLAHGPDGTFYAALGQELWRIDPGAGTETLIGSHGFGEVEALEYAFGDHDLQIEVPGVPPAWTAQGVLFGFSDDDDAFLIFDPDPVTGGAALTYDCPIETPDCEGIVFLTQSTDPTSGIIAGAFD
ncbi:MAG: hypothetical protein ACYSXF_03725 [Planctomycetota bacterium]|jgi:hypothetical protein